MMPPFPSPEFQDEAEAKAYLEQFLRPWFYLKPEVWLTYPSSANSLRIDYLAKPKPDTAFPFPIFGIECTASTYQGGIFNRAVKQAIDYAHCQICDRRPSLTGRSGQRVERVYIFPPPPQPPDQDYMRGWHASVERVAGLFHVGLIHIRFTGSPEFRMSGDRQWDADQGPIATPTHQRQLVGNGTLRRSADGAAP
jgi:hypothetical protein